MCPIKTVFVVFAVIFNIVVKADRFDYTAYDKVLKEYVDSDGMVNYKVLKSTRKELDTFVKSLADLKQTDYGKWSSNEKIAFWTNAYNALTLKAIIDNFPIKSSFIKSLKYPKNSIRQINGVWTKLKFNVMGKKLTLDHIEHKILRADFNEPRIHMALVCAAMGCPPLRNEAYSGDKLDEQLDDQSMKFLSSKLKFNIDGNTVHVSPIFKWFAEDFLKKYKGSPFAGKDGKEGAVLRFISKYARDKDKIRLKGIKNAKIVYHDYDWSLNEQKPTVKADK